MTAPPRCIPRAASPTPPHSLRLLSRPSPRRVRLGPGITLSPHAPWSGPTDSSSGDVMTSSTRRSRGCCRQSCPPFPPPKAVSRIGTCFGLVRRRHPRQTRQKLDCLSLSPRPKLPRLFFACLWCFLLSLPTCFVTRYVTALSSKLPSSQTPASCVYYRSIKHE